MEPSIRGMVIGLISGALATFLLIPLTPARHCPKCHCLLPRMRMPRSIRELLWGGWHCPECGSRVSRTGQFLP